MSRQSSSASTRRVITLVPPIPSTANVVISVAMWNMGPEFRYTVSSVMRCTSATVSAWDTIASCDSSAPLGRPPKAAVNNAMTGAAGSTAAPGSSGPPEARNVS